MGTSTCVGTRIMGGDAHGTGGGQASCGGSRCYGENSRGLTLNASGCYLWRLVGSCICSTAVLSGKEIPLKSMFGRRMLAGVVTMAGMLFSSGCEHKQPYVPTVVEIPAGFTTAWTAELDSAKNPIEQMYVRDDSIFVYTHSRLIYVLSRSGGRDCAWGEGRDDRPGGQVLAPVVLKKVAASSIPTTATLEVYDLKGKFIRSIDIGAPFRSGAIGVGSTVYVGTDTNNGGRVSAVDLDRPYSPVRWELMTFGGLSGDAGAVSRVTVRRRGRRARVCGQ